MAFNIFKKDEDKNKSQENEGNVVVQETAPETPVSETTPLVFMENSVLTNFYISEKAGLLNQVNQYVFKVSNNANKSQLSKQIEKMFNVKIKSVKMMNTPRKRRDVGRHPGFKPGFKKAVVVLEKGYSIERAKV